MRFERLTAVTIKMAVFCYMTPCSLVYSPYISEQPALMLEAADALETPLHIRLYGVALLNILKPARNDTYHHI